jgi:hypothetical protein
MKMIEWDAGTALAMFTAVGTGSAALAGIKVMVSGVREDISETKDALSEHVKEDHEVQTKILESIARIEVKQDLLLEDRRHDSGSAS